MSRESYVLLPYGASASFISGVGPYTNLSTLAFYCVMFVTLKVVTYIILNVCFNLRGKGLFVLELNGIAKVR